MKRDITLFIDDILESIKDIEAFTVKISKDDFFKNKEKQSAVVRQIEIIGEAVKNIPDFFREKYSNIPWSKIAGMRDIIIHGYFRVDLDAVWKVIKKDLPTLKKQILQVKKDS
ncbi:MAG: DUF86 domain-containing protein [Nanoarchaeota archaeon]